MRQLEAAGAAVAAPISSPRTRVFFSSVPRTVVGQRLTHRQRLSRESRLSAALRPQQDWRLSALPRPQQCWQLSVLPRPQQYWRPLALPRPQQYWRLSVLPRPQPSQPQVLALKLLLVALERLLSRCALLRLQRPPSTPQRQLRRLHETQLVSTQKGRFQRLRWWSANFCKIH